jgi:hypothetical protein
VNQSAPTISDVAARSATISWAAVGRANGVLTSYSVLLNGAPVYTGLAQSTTITSLTPFMTYSAIVLACNNAGCFTSDSQQFSTLEAGLHLICIVIYCLVFSRSPC